MSTRITHWIGGKPWAGTSERQGSVYDPATGRESGRVDLASAGVVDEAVQSAAAAAAEWRNASLTRRTQVVFAFRELLNARKQRAGRDHHRRARQGALRRARRGRPRPGGRGVRVRHPAPAQGRLLRERVDRRRRLLDPPAARRRRGHHAVQLPGHGARCGSSRSPSPAATPCVLKPSEKDPSAAVWLAELWAEAGLPDGVFNVVHGDKEAVDALLEHPDVRCDLASSARRRSRATSTSAAPATGKRVQALGGAKNHMVVLPDADLDLAADAAVNAGFGSAGERCMAISAVVAVDPVGDELVAKIAERMAGLRVGDGSRSAPTWGPLDHRRAPRQGGVLRRRRARRPGPGWWSTAASQASTARRRLLARPDPLRPGPTGHVALHATRSSARCCRSCASPATTRRSRWSTPTPTATARRSSPTTAAPRGVTRTRSRSAWSASTCRSRCRWPTTRSAAGRTRCSATRTRTAPEGVHFFTRGKVVTSRWLDPSHGGINLGFPTQSKGDR